MEGERMMEQFHYTHNGVEFSIPHAKNIKVGVIRKNRKLPEHEQAFAILEAVVGDAALEQIDDMTASEFETFMAKWQAESGITLGESSASPES